MARRRGEGRMRGQKPPPVGKRRARGNRWLVLFAIAAVAAIGAGIVAGWGGSSSALPPVPPSRLPGELTGPAPWPRNVAELRARLDALDLLSQEGTMLHTHEHLDLYVHGRRILVPSNIGIDEREGFVSPLHTHDDSGIIHVESPVVRTYTLGEFFGVWGVRLTPRCLGGYCAQGTDELRVYMDGRLLPGDPRQLALEPHEEIVIAYGTRAELPQPIPSEYRFPYGL